MTLVDTSAWIDHFRRGNAALARLLDDEEAAVHPFVIGELAAGNLKNRAGTLDDLSRMPPVCVAAENEVRHLVESRRLWGRGLGWVDLHLLAAAALAGLNLLTSDRAMAEAASLIGIPTRR